MTEARFATPADAAEIVRLRALMLSSMDGAAVPHGPWEDTVAEDVIERLQDDEPTLGVVVVDQSDHAGRLAACAVGTIEYRFGSPANPSGAVGYVFNVSTDPDYRRRGYSRACMEMLLAWFVEHGVTRIDLKASADGEPLYRSLGFHTTHDPAMRLDLKVDPEVN